MIYLYAMLEEEVAMPRVRGVASERIRIVRCGRLYAVVGGAEVRPAASRTTLSRHDAVVRRLARVAAAVLPARFGSVWPDERGLRARVRPVAAPLGRALSRVRDREQMTLRVFADETPDPAGAGPGTRWLLRRGLVELAPLRELLAPIVRGERTSRHASPPLVASLYHLIDRGAARAYTRIVRMAARRAPRLRLRASGPFAPYAFAPDSLG